MQNSLDILFNLGMLASLSIISGFIGYMEKRSKLQLFYQGLLFGVASVIGMLNPLVLAPGLIFDGRSVMLSVCGLFFGPIAAAVSVVMPLLLRIWQGGPGATMGVSVILSASAIGVLFHYYYYHHFNNRLKFSRKRWLQNNTAMLYFMGIVVHVIMVLFMFTLPKERALDTIKLLGIPIIVAYPLATVLIGKILHEVNERRHIVEALRISEQNLSASHSEIESTLEEVIAQEEEIRSQLAQIAHSEERFRTMIEQAPLGINLSDIETGIISQANQAYCDIVGRPLNEVIGASWRDLTHPEDLEANIELNKALIDGRQDHFEMIKRYVRQDGSIIWVNIKNTLLGYGHDNINHELCFIEDITEKKKISDALADNERSFRSIFEGSADTILIFEKDKINDCNLSALKMFGFTSKESLIKSPVELIAPEFQDDGMSSKEKAILLLQKCRKELSIRFEWVHKKSDGTLFPVEVVLTHIFLHGKSLIHAVVRDISERKILEKSLEHLSYHDQLTGIYNRRFFEEEVSRLNVPRNHPLTLMMADVNGLKLINDSFGHKAGDELLKKVALILKSSCREDDVVSRIGGDEFVVLLPKTHSKEAEEISNRIQALVAKETIESLEISLSLGWASITDESSGYADVLKKAEDYLYRKKLFESPSMRNKSIHTMIHTLHEKNKREEHHSYRVSILCEGMGKTMGLNDSKVKELKHLGLLHDIGKIAIDEQMLNKPGKLNDDEWREMTKHPEIGYRILSTVNEMSEMAESVLTHHERFDGKGYPRGIKGHDIPLNARIITIADAYDAMTCSRPYKSTLTQEAAIAELKNHSGTQFDPELVEVFLTMLSNDNTIAEVEPPGNIEHELDQIFR